MYYKFKLGVTFKYTTSPFSCYYVFFIILLLLQKIWNIKSNIWFFYLSKNRLLLILNRRIMKINRIYNYHNICSFVKVISLRILKIFILTNKFIAISLVIWVLTMSKNDTGFIIVQGMRNNLKSNQLRMNGKKYFLLYWSIF